MRRRQQRLAAAAAGEVYSGPFPSIKGQARPTQQQREPPSTHSLSPVHALQRAQDQQSALAHYPWATSFEDGQGQIKNRYNLPSGSMLQPMVHLDGAHKQLQSIRRKELFAAEMRPGTATACFSTNSTDEHRMKEGRGIALMSDEQGKAEAKTAIASSAAVLESALPMPRRSWS